MPIYSGNSGFGMDLSLAMRIPFRLRCSKNDYRSGEKGKNGQDNLNYVKLDRIVSGEVPNDLSFWITEQSLWAINIVSSDWAMMKDNKVLSRVAYNTKGLTAPFWIRMSHLPLQCWDEINVSRIASKIGHLKVSCSENGLEVKRGNLPGGLEGVAGPSIGAVEGNSVSAKPIAVNQVVIAGNSVGGDFDSNSGPWIHVNYGKAKFKNSWKRRATYNTFMPNIVKVQAAGSVKAAGIVNGGVGNVAGGIACTLGVKASYQEEVAMAHDKAADLLLDIPGAGTCSDSMKVYSALNSPVCGRNPVSITDDMYTDVNLFNVLNVVNKKLEETATISDIGNNANSIVHKIPIDGNKFNILNSCGDEEPDDGLNEKEDGEIVEEGERRFEKVEWLNGEKSGLVKVKLQKELRSIGKVNILARNSKNEKLNKESSGRNPTVNA
ncbi:hypothetical protein M5K25_002461 [Dendrobium thyrsiflorum]|uniref:DUF4283 domain-containing protein n=1 Tax=Dendrobium thyrsiflorum TaxID=117978 RepID=A0ABD0VU51_DENTH